MMYFNVDFTLAKPLATNFVDDYIIPWKVVNDKGEVVKDGNEVGVGSTCSFAEDAIKDNAEGAQNSITISIQVRFLDGASKFVFGPSVN